MRHQKNPALAGFYFLLIILPGIIEIGEYSSLLDAAGAFASKAALYGGVVVSCGLTCELIRYLLGEMLD